MLLTSRSRANLLLLLTAAVWGFAFVAQRTGMEHVGPFAFNGIRFAIGALVLLPFIRYRDSEHGRRRGELVSFSNRFLLLGGLAAGTVLFAAATLQQAGLVTTTAGKAGFITGLYVVLVPILGLAFGWRPGPGVWAGALLAAVGLYLLTIQDGLRMELGDLLVLGGAFLWAGHFLLLGRLSPGTDTIKLAFVQFVACAALSLLAAALFETVTGDGLRQALPAILYAGVFSVGIGYTLQVVGQRHAEPAHAAIILSLEAVFAVIGGWLLLGEQLSTRALIGCALMLAGIVLSQLFSPPGMEVAEISH